MTTFVRRVPQSFDEAYWNFGSRYMERELGAVPATEHTRHDKPDNVVGVAGEAHGHSKDMPYCFAPYDGLRGLDMRDVVSFDELGEAVSSAPTPKLEMKKIMEAPVPAALPPPSSFQSLAPGAAGSDQDADKGIPLPAIVLGAAALFLLLRR